MHLSSHLLLHLGAERQRDLLRDGEGGRIRRFERFDALEPDGPRAVEQPSSAPAHAVQREARESLHVVRRPTGRLGRRTARQAGQERSVAGRTAD